MSLNYSKINDFLFLKLSKLKRRIISPNATTIKNIDEHIKAGKVIAFLMGKTNTSSIEIIGHGACSWNHYPMGIKKRGVVYGNTHLHYTNQPVNVREMFDRPVFSEHNISIELDAQFPPENHDITKMYPEDGSYILHNIPKWEHSSTTKNEVVNYLHKNTLKRVLDNIVAKEIYKTTKVYIELKSTKACYGKNGYKHCSIQAAKLAEELENYLPFSVSTGNWLCITSFNPNLLKALRVSLKDKKDQIDYVLIAGYTGGYIKSKLASLKGYVPRFDNEIKNFAIQNEWVETIWFSTQGIKNYASVFNEVIDGRRVLKHKKELKFSFAFYPQSIRSIKKIVLKNSDFKGQIKSFMIDILQDT